MIRFGPRHYFLLMSKTLGIVVLMFRTGVSSILPEYNWLLFWRHVAAMLLALRVAKLPLIHCQ